MPLKIGKHGEQPGWKESLPPRDTSPVAMIQKETEQTNICLATLGAAYTSPDYYPIMLINALLGDGMSSRLFQTLREEQGLAYDIGSYFNSYSETGNLVISAGVDPYTDRTLPLRPSLTNSTSSVKRRYQQTSLHASKPMYEAAFYWD